MQFPIYSSLQLQENNFARIELGGPRKVGKFPLGEKHTTVDLQS